MSDFKFACPVCGQHITAHSSTSGQEIACPTCFRKIVVPQAPTGPETKLILSAAQAGQPRANSIASPADLGPLRRSRAWSNLGVGLGWLFLIGVAGALLVVFRGSIFPSLQTHRAAGAHTIYPIPTNIVWTLSLADADIPDAPAEGRVHGQGFRCEQASLRGGTLTLSQGSGWPPDLGLSVRLFARHSRDLSGKSLEVTAERMPPLPRVVLNWKDEQDQPRTLKLEGGYALRLIFGQVSDGRLPGKVYLCLPDEAKSFVAGTFEADIRKSSQPLPPAQPY
jgi:DNA-directed RNA polymerase subunit RPC12/RpoP